MFALDLWDSPEMLLGEVALSIAIIVAVMFVARLANKRSVDPRSARTPSQQGPVSNPENSTEARSLEPDGQEANAEADEMQPSGMAR